jgi:predicted permease
MPEWKQEIRERLTPLKLAPTREAEIVEEFSQHLEDRYAELLAGGAMEEEAARMALADLSESETLQRELRRVERLIKHEPVVLGARRTNMLKDSLQDLRYGLRLLRRSPGFAAVAVLSLALGIGANSVIFTALDAVLWKPLPVADPDSLVRFAITRANRDDTNGAPTAFAEGLANAGVFTDVITQTGDGLSFSDGDRAERVVGEVVSANFFPALGVAPILGQGFTPEVRAGHWAPEVVLSYRFWKQRFSGDPGVIGRTVHLNTYPFTIVGVSSPTFFDVRRGFEPELRLPGLPAGQQLSQIALLGSSPPVMARLKPGVTIAQAEAAADIQFQEFLRTTTAPEISRAGYQHLRLLAGARGFSGGVDQFQAPLFALFALVAIVLLIACANVANLLLARATARHRELAVRASVGASRSRLIRQMLAESALLSLLGGALALVVASWAAPALLSFLPQGHIGIVLDLHPDARVLLFTFALSFLTCVLFGLAPAVQATRGDLAAKLKADSNASVGDSRRTGLRQLLVVAQVGLSLTLLIVTGACLRTVANLRPTEFQASSDRVFLFTMKPQEEIYTPERKGLLVTELLRRVSELRGVGGVALAENGPLGSRSDDEWLEAPGHDPIRIDVDWVSPRFFDTVGVPLLAGRDFTAADKQGAPPVVIVNQSLARELFKNENPIGQSLSFSYGRSARRPREVVGIVADTHYYDVHKAPRPTAWFTFQEYTPYMPTLHVRAEAPDAAGMVEAVRREFDALDKGFPVFNIKTLELRIEDKLSQERLVAGLAAAFGVLALLLAAVGLYGVLAYAVSRRAREIGVRMALGATRADVLRMILKESAWLVVMGIAVGAPMAIAATRLISTTLFGLGAVDPLTILIAALMLVGVAAVTSFLPARRAAQVDPMVALRCE